ncbi:hypothetical protein LCGC14_1114270 [marine sediment metagenome]|uniref:Uncharacterized protein n=2 Tax=root TaxID=1 RepID=A0A831QT47_9FLAO|nr:hypothetical protein [Pricia sp.]HEA22736.1 hypothetical protein [Pricia antarctica]
MKNIFNILLLLFLSWLFIIGVFILGIMIFEGVDQSNLFNRLSPFITTIFVFGMGYLIFKLYKKTKKPKLRSPQFKNYKHDYYFRYILGGTALIVAGIVLFILSGSLISTLGVSGFGLYYKAYEIYKE